MAVLAVAVASTAVPMAVLVVLVVVLVVCIAATMAAAACACCPGTVGRLDQLEVAAENGPVMMLLKTVVPALSAASGLTCMRRLACAATPALGVSQPRCAPLKGSAEHVRPPECTH